MWTISAKWRVPIDFLPLAHGQPLYTTHTFSYNRCWPPDVKSVSPLCCVKIWPSLQDHLQTGHEVVYSFSSPAAVTCSVISNYVNTSLVITSIENLVLPCCSHVPSSPYLSNFLTKGFGLPYLSSVQVFVGTLVYRKIS